MSLKGNSEGSIFFNKQRNTWSAQYIDYNSQTGEIKKKTKSFKTEKDAQNFLDTIMYQKENPIYIEHNGIPLLEVMKSNLKLKLETNQISPTQFGRVSQTLEQLAKITVCNKKIDDISPDEVQEYLNTLKHLSNSTINKIYQQFNQSFKVAINKG